MVTTAAPGAVAGWQAQDQSQHQEPSQAPSAPPSRKSAKPKAVQQEQQGEQQPQLNRQEAKRQTQQNAQPRPEPDEKPNAGQTVGQYILAQLAAWGVRRIYGVIGDAVLYLFDDIAKQDKIQYVPFLDENAAALAAAAEAKLTGGIAVVVGTSGPGLANMLNGLGDAWADGARVLAITGQVEEEKIGTHSKQYLQQQLAVQPFAAISETIAHPDALPEVLARCLAVCIARGAVAHLSIPKALFRQPIQAAVRPYLPHWHQRLYAPREAIEETFLLISKASRPMLIAGRGCEGAERETLAFAEALGAAAAATLTAHHIFPNDHELYLGGYGMAGSDAARQAMQESDLIIVCGATWWPDEFVPPSARIVQIDAVRENIGVNMPAAHGLVGDLRDIMPQLAAWAASLKRDSAAAKSWRRRIAELRKEWHRRLAKEMKAPEPEDGLPRQAPPGTAPPPSPRKARQKGRRDKTQHASEPPAAANAAPPPMPGNAPPPMPPPGNAPLPKPKPPLVPQRIMKLLSEAIPPEAIVALDTGEHTLWWGRCFKNRGQRVLLSGRWRTLGFALPAAIASGLAAPEQPVVAIAGDGGAPQTLIELKTAARLGLAITLIIWNNGVYAMEQNRMHSAGLEPFGTTLDNPDFTGLAKALGAEGFRADDEETFAHALAAAFASDRPKKPFLIEVVARPDAVPLGKA